MPDSRIGSRMTARIHKIFGFCILAGLSGPQYSLSSDFKVISEKRQAGFQELILVGQELQQHPVPQSILTLRDSSAHVFLVSEFASKQDSINLMQAGPVERDYEGWLGALRDVPNRESFQMSDLISINHNTVVRSIKGNKVSRVFLEGSDPTKFLAGGRRCEILEIFFGRRKTFAQSSPMVVDVYLRTDSLPTRLEAKAITAYVQTALHYSVVDVGIRMDSWFNGDSRFPLWFPFDGFRRPPTKEEQRSSGHVFCRGSEKSVECYP